MTESSQTTQLVRNLADKLRQSGDQLVFAESCTAGLASATLAEVPGISQHLCGSAVVYQVPTKVAWLKIAPDIIDSEGYASEAVARAMSAGVLNLTSHATLAAAITGDLGPDAPAETDGTAWIAVESQDGRSLTKLVELPDSVPDNPKEPGLSLRLYRQRAAVSHLLNTILEFLDS